LKCSGGTLEKSTVEAVHILTHPLRFKIVEALRRSGEPMFIAQIADAINADHKLVSFHLMMMLKHGLVEGEWKVSSLPRSRGKAVKYYKLTSKVEESFSRCSELVRT